MEVDFQALQLTFRRSGEGYEARVELGYEAGGRSGWREFRLRASEDGEPVPRFGRVELAMPKGGGKLKVALRQGKKVLLEEEFRVKPLKAPVSDPLLKPEGDELKVVLIGRGADSVAWELEGKKGGLRWEEGDTLSFKVSLKGVYPGERTLRLRLFKEGREIDRREAKFKRLGNFYLDPKHFRAIISALEFAYPGKVGELKRATDRERAWKRFWRKIDPTGEAERVFLERYAYAYEHWRRFDGTLGDMGKVYVKYGPPDWVERHPFELDMRPYEIWYYDQYGLRFIFIDRNGTGEYELVQPGFYNEFGF